MNACGLVQPTFTLLELLLAEKIKAEQDLGQIQGLDLGTSNTQLATCEYAFTACQANVASTMRFAYTVHGLIYPAPYCIILACTHKPHTTDRSTSHSHWGELLRLMDQLPLNTIDFICWGWSRLHGLEKVELSNASESIGSKLTESDSERSCVSFKFRDHHHGGVRN